jgi:hypothetical protein
MPIPLSFLSISAYETRTYSEQGIDPRLLKFYQPFDRNPSLLRNKVLLPQPSPSSLLLVPPTHAPSPSGRRVRPPPPCPDTGAPSPCATLAVPLPPLSAAVADHLAEREREREIEARKPKN